MQNRIIFRQKQIPNFWYQGYFALVYLCSAKKNE